MIFPLPWCCGQTGLTSPTHAPVSSPSVLPTSSPSSKESPSINSATAEQDEQCEEYGDDEFAATSPVNTVKPASSPNPPPHDAPAAKSIDDTKESDMEDEEYGDDYGEDEFSATSPSAAMASSLNLAPANLIIDNPPVINENKADEEEEDYGEDDGFSPASPDPATTVAQSQPAAQVDYSTEFYDAPHEDKGGDDDDYGGDSDFE